ncbi:MAG TPA: hypothetical protein IAB49_02165 [Candidatus Caccenecus avistercoris]|nr:hypothetical protein [Candidatus Caccenecus avistercoris]
MHTDIFNNIDLLIEMAGSTLNTLDIEGELRDINKEIQDKKGQIEDLKGMMNDTRYFNASSELVDKNIEVSLKSKISRLNRKIKDIQLRLNDVKKEEAKTHDDVIALKDRIEKNKEYISLLESKSGKLDSAYQSIVEQENMAMESLKQELAKKDKRYQEVLRELEVHEQALKELSDKKNSDSARLREIEDNLGNPNAYIDEDLKSHDEERLNSLNESLVSLQKRRLEYLTDPNMIGMDAKELIANNDFTEALKKIKELVTIVKAKPFMDITNKQILDEELEKKEAERTELANYIDSKNYAGMSSNVAQKRIEYLNKELEKEKALILQYQEENKKIEQEIGEDLSPLIGGLEEEIRNISSEIEDYQTLLQDNTKSRKTKTNLENAILKKEKEKDAMNDILDNYKKDLLFKIKSSNRLEKLLERYNQDITQKTEEIEELNRMALFDGASKDYIEEEQDKEKLKKINDEIKQIKNCRKYDRTPDEIYDQIEMLLANTKVDAPIKEEKEEENQVEAPIDGLFDNEPTKEEPLIKVVEMIPATTVSEMGGHSYGA